MVARFVFTSFLLGSTLYSQIRVKDPSVAPFFQILYLLIVVIFLLSFLYAVLSRHIKRQPLFGYMQIGVDSFIVTLILFITGGFYSLFSFLYLVVIIYASMILYLRGGLVLAIMSSFQYALLVLLQYAAIVPSLGTTGELSLYSYSLTHIFYKILITSAACFAVALLSGLLTEQNRKTQKELRAMEAHVKRVEKMAYMGEMAAGLAHEIKNPLASVVGAIQMLKEDLRYDPDNEHLMDIILRETDRLGSLVNNFLFFARPPAGKPKKINLRNAINEITALFERDAIHARKLSLRKDLSKDIWVVMDPTHLSQVLWNLLLNAAEAIEDDGYIEIKASTLKNNNASVQVIDNGCGIPSDVVQSIFDPFYTTKQEGTGLGLSIVHRILEAYESRLEVNTKPNDGTTFSFTLPQTSSAT